MTSLRHDRAPARTQNTGAWATAIAAGLALAAAASADVIHVSGGAPPGGNGWTWASAFNDLQHAIALAQPGDEIWVAAGTYTPAPPGGSRYFSFHLDDGVALFGGFAGWETARDERDWEVNETILSGDLNGDDGPDLATSAENSYHVVAGRGVDPTAVLDGFTITGGNTDWATGPPYTEWSHGGGMYNENASPLVAHCTFQGNRAEDGGGMYNLGSSPSIVECRFMENVAYGAGGGLRNEDQSHATIISCVFDCNSASGGGGAATAGNSIVTVAGCEFLDNAGWVGGGFDLHHGSHAFVTASRFVGNHAGAGVGAFACFDSTLRAVGCFFRDNESAYSFAGLVIDGPATPSELVNCVFVGNTATQLSGAITDACGSSIINCTIAGNTAGESPDGPSGGGGIISIGLVTVVQNSIVWGNTPDQIATHDGGSALVSFSDIQGGWPGSNNINADPLFVQLGTGDVRLAFGSPCLDAGDNSFLPPDVTTDAAGTPRIQNGVVDMGAYEGAFDMQPPAASDEDLDPGEVATLTPEGGGFDPLHAASIILVNTLGPDNASALVTQHDTDMHPDAGSYEEIADILDMQTSIDDGQMYMQVFIPFTDDDLDGRDPMQLDLVVFDPDTGDWTLAVLGNTVSSPGHSGPAGDRFPVTGDALPPISYHLGDWGVFYNPAAGEGVAWANLDHASEFAVGAVLCTGDVAVPADGVVDAADLATLLAEWTGHPPTPPGSSAADLNGDGFVDTVDLLMLLGLWGACP